VQLFCQGLNYADHREESGLSDARDEENLIFMKAASSICGPNDTILRPAGCRLLDYEIELALVMKKGASAPVSITEDDLPDYVGGLVLCNDVSARDMMFGSPMLQWFRGKSQRTFCPMGPVLYLLDSADFRNLYSLQLTLRLNGEVKQSASTDLLIHRPAATLEELSTFADFHAGDCLLTGTPGGVLASGNLRVALAVILNLKNDPKRRRKFTEAQLSQSRFLEPGDELELSIRSEDGSIDLGVQRNQIADA
jgi:2-keto-4-pentenoate hydratase/2-oxohepta-3-ene-1,7-dioic acid hydratase in catechol pathway